MIFVGKPHSISDNLPKIPLRAVSKVILTTPLIYNTITFSSSLEEEYPEYSGGGGVLLGQPHSPLTPFGRRAHPFTSFGLRFKGGTIRDN